jgi:hypothetical protein
MGPKDLLRVSTNIIKAFEGRLTIVVNLRDNRINVAFVMINTTRCQCVPHSLG